MSYTKGMKVQGRIGTNTDVCHQFFVYNAERPERPCLKFPPETFYD